MTYRRPAFETLLRRTKEPRRFIQVVAGPRQVGKTTLVRQVLESLELPSHYASADDPAGRDRAWLREQWDIGRLLSTDSRRGAVLVIDEIQKVDSWSELVKAMWDADSAASSKLRVVLLGSSPLLVQRGLGESLAGRFELVQVSHWSLSEMREAFGWGLDTYLFYGGYPGAVALIGDRARWSAYVLDSLVETTLARDILLLSRVDKPALLRQLFSLATSYSGQILSYTKMLGQLQDAGNTTTLSHYLQLLSGAGLVSGLERFSGSVVRQRASSPKLIARNTGLISARSGVSVPAARRDPASWGRLVETAVGAHLLNHSPTGLQVMYWRERQHEVDFVLQRGEAVVGIEVTTSRHKRAGGMDAFARRFSPRRTLLVGAGGIELEDFLSSPPERWLK
ncbi:MAG: ATP-binding protein [Actinomycetota bacterium]